MKAKVVFVVPHTHYDVAWAFNKEDYLHINETIFKKALEMIKTKDFRFLVEQTYLLEQIEYRDPQLFSEITEAILNEKLEIADGQYLMPDPMLPTGEVLLREILFGRRYCKEKFGIEVLVAWAADGFGLNAQMPQILRKSGYKWLAFRRGIPKAIGYRVSEFYWEGLDGTKILTHWMPMGYRAGLYLDKWEESLKKLSVLAATDNILMPCGSGGAIPQDEIPDKIIEWNKTHKHVKMQIATPRDFFKAVERSKADFITYKGELYSSDLENIFPDVVSSRMRLKLAIRECENRIIRAEKIAALAMIAGHPYPHDRLVDLWKKMLFLGFHDIVPSCGIDEIYREAWEYISDIKKHTHEMTRVSLKQMVKKMSGDIGIAVINPNSWEMEDWVEARVHLGAGWRHSPGIALKDKEIPSEPVEVERWDDGSIREAKIGFIAKVPPFGVRVYRLVKKNKKFRRKSGIDVNDNKISTKLFDIAINKANGIIEVFDKKGNGLLKGNEIIIDEEIGDLYFHESKLEGYIGSESGVGVKFGAFKPGSFKIEKKGLRTIITCTDEFYCLRWPYYLSEKFGNLLYRHKSLDVVKKIILYEDLPRIDFETYLNLRQSHVRIRLKFDTCMVVPAYRRQTQFGVIDIPYSKTLEKTIKTATLNWICCEENNRGIGFLTHGMPINEIKGGEIYCTLLRSVSVLAANGQSGPLVPVPEAMELGEHFYKYSVVFYEGDWRDAEVYKTGMEFSQPLLAAQVDNVPSEVKISFISIKPENIVASALKKAEDDNSIILRFFETTGKKSKAKITLPPNVKAVKETNLIEEETGKEYKIRNGKVERMVNPFEIVTLKLVL